MDCLQGCLKNMESKKPYLAMIFVQSVYAGMCILSKASIAQGMNPYVFVAYRQAFATLTLAPFAFFFERKSAARLSFTLLCKIALLSSGITVSLNLWYFALEYVSATFSTALSNTSPVIAFILAVCFGMERLSIRQSHGVLKVMGSTIGLLGALICTFAIGPAMYSESQTDDILHLSKQSYSKSDWIKGSLIILAANTAWCLWLIMQAPIIRQYPAKLRLVALQCFFSCVSSAVWAYAKDRDIESWKIDRIMNLVSVLYSGVIVNAVAYWLLLWVTDKRGPVFSAAFAPLTLIITAIFSALLFQEILHWGSVSGAILLVVGLYGILWGKSREGKADENKIEAENEEEMEGSEKKVYAKEETEFEGISCQI